MIYIDTIKLPTHIEIEDYMFENYNLYPWTIFYENRFEWVICKDITILYGNNGSGKSTLLNLIAERLHAQRQSDLFKDVVYGENGPIHPFNDFVEHMSFIANNDEITNRLLIPKHIKLITSDDIFKRIDERSIHNKKSIIEAKNAIKKQNEMLDKRYTQNVFKSLDDYDELVNLIEARKMSSNQYANAHSRTKQKMRSNGETALDYYSEIFESGGIYLLDEPENSLSPIFQIKLIELINDAVKYFDCQFIICTHSPFILSLNNSVIYNLDLTPVMPQKWFELENSKIYYEFFKKHKKEFENN